MTDHGGTAIETQGSDFRTGKHDTERLATLARGRSVATIAVALLALSALSGCGLFQDDMCFEGEQPLYALDNPNAGLCIADGEKVPDGFATYLENRVPQKVGDEYDRWPLAEDYPWADEIKDD